MLFVAQIIHGYFIVQVGLFFLGMFVVLIEKKGVVKGHRKLVEMCISFMKANVKWMVFFIGVYLVFI